jgi:hypothetical protein
MTTQPCPGYLRGHNYRGGTCTGCGERQPGRSDTVPNRATPTPLDTLHALARDVALAEADGRQSVLCGPDEAIERVRTADARLTVEWAAGHIASKLASLRQRAVEGSPSCRIT